MSEQEQGQAFVLFVSVLLFGGVCWVGGSRAKSRRPGQALSCVIVAAVLILVASCLFLDMTFSAAEAREASIALTTYYR